MGGHSDNPSLSFSSVGPTRPSGANGQSLTLKMVLVNVMSWSMLLLSALSLLFFADFVVVVFVVFIVFVVFAVFVVFVVFVVV